MAGAPPILFSNLKQQPSTGSREEAAADKFKSFDLMC